MFHALEEESLAMFDVAEKDISEEIPVEEELEIFSTGELHECAALFRNSVASVNRVHINVEGFQVHDVLSEMPQYKREDDCPSEW